MTDTLQSDILLSQESIEHVCPCPDQLTENGISAKVLFSGGQHLDLLPRGGGKGPALAYILNEVLSLPYPAAMPMQILSYERRTVIQ